MGVRRLLEWWKQLWRCYPTEKSRVCGARCLPNPTFSSWPPRERNQKALPKSKSLQLWREKGGAAWWSSRSFFVLLFSSLILPACTNSRDSEAVAFRSLLLCVSALQIGVIFAGWCVRWAELNDGFMRQFDEIGGFAQGVPVPADGWGAREPLFEAEDQRPSFRRWGHPWDRRL